MAEAFPRPRTAADALEGSAKTVPVYFVRADHDDGESLDLIVRAASAEQAVTLWRSYYALGESARPQWTGVIPGVAGEGVGAVSWSDIHSG